MTGTPLRWLIFSYFTGVDGMAASVHVQGMVSELQRRGHTVSIITSPVCAPTRGESRRVFSPAPSGIRFELRHIFKRVRNPLLRPVKHLLMLALFPFYVLEKILFHAEPQWSWWLTASLAGIREAGRKSPQLIFSTCGPYSAHQAALLVSRGLGIPWIAEYRDPIKGHRRGRRFLENRLISRVEKRVGACASGTVFFTQSAKEDSAKRVAYQGRLVSIPSGAPALLTLPTPWPGDRNHLRIGHFGSLSGGRSLKGLVKALSLIRAGDRGLAGQLSIHQFGHTSQQIMRETTGLEDIFFFHGRVPHERALMTMGEFDALLLVQDLEPISALYIPAKTYEYLHLKRPILALVYRNPELKQMLLELGHFPVEMDDPEGIADVVLSVRDLWARGENRWNSDSPYTQERAVDELERLAENVVEKWRDLRV